MKLNIKKPYASAKWSFINKITGRQHMCRVRLLHEYRGKDYPTGSRSRPIHLYSNAIYNLIMNA